MQYRHLEPLFARIIVSVLLLSITSCSTTPVARRPSSEPPSPDAAHMLMMLRTQTIVSLVTEELKEELKEGLSAQSLQTSTSPQESQTASALQTMAEREFADNPAALQRAGQVDYPGLAHAIHESAKKMSHNLRSSARITGLDVEMTFAIATLVNYIGPIFLVALGQPGLAAGILAFPVGTVTTILYSALKQTLHHHQMVALYGGRKNYRYQLNLESAARKKLHFHKDTDLYLAITAPDTAEGAVILSDDGTLADTLEFLRLKKTRLSYHDLRRLAREHGLTREERQNLEKDTTDRTMRASLLFSWIESHLTDIEFADLKKHYAESFVAAPHEPEIFALNQWAARALDVKSCDQLFAYIKNVPAGVRLPYVADAWYRVIIPSLAETLEGPSIRQVHKMIAASQDFSILGRLARGDFWPKISDEISTESSSAHWSNDLNKIVELACTKI